MFIETETTPNPASLKFLPGQQVMAQGTREFASPEAAEASPLAQAIFDTGEVVNVFFGGDFVTVTVAPGASWSDLKPQVLAILLDHFVAQAPLFTPGSAGGIAVPPEDEGMLVEEREEDGDIIAQINELLETRVRPAVAAISSIAATATAWSICRCRAPVRAARPPPPRSSMASRDCSSITCPRSSKSAPPDPRHPKEFFPWPIPFRPKRST